MDLSLRQSARSPFLKSWQTLVYAVPPARSCFRFPLSLSQPSLLTKPLFAPVIFDSLIPNKRSRGGRPPNQHDLFFIIYDIYRNINRRSDHICSNSTTPSTAAWSSIIHPRRTTLAATTEKEIHLDTRSRCSGRLGCRRCSPWERRQEE